MPPAERTFRSLLATKGYPSIRSFVRAVRVDPGTVRGALRGKRRASGRVIAKIAKHLEVPISVVEGLLRGEVGR